MPIIIRIDERGISDIGVLASDSEETHNLTKLYHELKPEIESFQKTISKKIIFDKTVCELEEPNGIIS